MDGLEDAARLQVGQYWQGRSAAELHVADGFSKLREILAEAGGDEIVLRLIDRTVKNEHQHSRLCHRLAIRYLGREVDEPPAVPARLPPLDEAPAEARATLHMAGLCCVNESIATVWLERCAARSTAPLARGVNQLHLSDEVLHARVGWAHLASRAVTGAVRAEVGRWVVPLLKSNVGIWLGPDVTKQAGGVPGHGLPLAEEHRQVVLGAVRNVVIPGFQHCGVDVGPAWRWFHEELEVIPPAPRNSNS